MSLTDLLALLPIIAIATVGVVLMMVIAFKRDYELAWRSALIGLLVSLLTVPVALDSAPVRVTELIIIDRYSLFFTTLLFMAGGFVLVFCHDYFKGREGENEELFLLILFALLGAVVLVCSYHFASFFIGLEILSVSMYALIAYPINQRRSLEAAIKYLVLSGVSSAFLLFGMALIYADIGTFVFDRIGQLLTISAEHPYSVIGMIMIVIGLAFKLSLAPFHLWTSDVYEGAPAPVTAFVATVSKGAIFAVMLRFFITAEFYRFEVLYSIVVILAIVTIIAGNLLALLQNNVKRILAYSSIAHFGYLLVIFAASFVLTPEFVVESTIFYLLIYIITTLGSFGVVSVLSTVNREAETLNDYSGLFWSQPWLATMFTVMLMSLAGIPLTAGFIAKFYVFATGVHGELWVLLSMVVVGSAVGLFYYLRIIMQMTRQSTPATVNKNENSALTMADNAALSILTGLLIWFGVVPSGIMQLIAVISRPFG